MATQRRPLTPDLPALAGLFYANLAEVGSFDPVALGQMPPDYRDLLAHTNHMTVTVERYYGEPVDVEVLATRLDENRYARKILLRRRSDRRIVQFGIMRLDFRFVSREVRRAVESQSAPLGRILIEHNVLREIHLMELWRVTPADELRRLLTSAPGQITFGRSALIDCNDQPGVELLEIVAPLVE